MEKLKDFLKKLVKCIANPRFLLCFGLAWMITNGWAYVLLGIGTFCNIGWMIAVSSAYLAFIWIPVTPEKIITIAIAIFLLQLLFPNDEKTLGMLRELQGKRKEKKEKKKKREVVAIATASFFTLRVVAPTSLSFSHFFPPKKKKKKKNIHP